MRIKKGSIRITIADDNPIALKIKEGYEFDIVEGEIKVGKMYSEPKNKWQFIKEIEKATSIPEIKIVIAKVIEQWPE